jgi:hypothetical protein
MKLTGRVFESKAWYIQIEEDMVFVVNKRFESEGRIEADIEVTADMVETFQMKGLKVPQYLRDELALLFFELDALEKQETEMELVGIQDVSFDMHSKDRPARVYKDQYGSFTSFKYRDVYSGERLGFICLTEKAHGGLMITFDPYELARYRDGRSTLEEYKATLEPQELTVEQVQKELSTWILNGQLPTGEQEPYTWKGKELQASVMKYTFVENFEFDKPVYIFDTSERGAWNQLYNAAQANLVTYTVPVPTDEEKEETVTTLKNEYDTFKLVRGKIYDLLVKSVIQDETTVHMPKYPMYGMEFAFRDEDGILYFKDKVLKLDGYTGIHESRLIQLQNTEVQI